MEEAPAGKRSVLSGAVVPSDVHVLISRILEYLRLQRGINVASLGGIKVADC